MDDWNSENDMVEDKAFIWRMSATGEEEGKTCSISDSIEEAEEAGEDKDRIFDFFAFIFKGVASD
jgi:hypothetical protein